jgi:hypothetical protein
MLSSATLSVNTTNNALLASKVELSSGSIIVYTPVLSSVSTLYQIYRLDASVSPASPLVSTSLFFPAESTNPVLIPLGTHVGVSFDSMLGSYSMVF